MEITRFILKILAAITAPLLLAVIVSALWSLAHPRPVMTITHDETFGDPIFATAILGLIVLSFVLPIFLTVREIQAKRSAVRSLSVLAENTWKS